MSGGFYMNGFEVSDVNDGASSSTQVSASTSSDAIKMIRENIKKTENLNAFETCLDYCEEALRLSPASLEFKITKAKFLVLTHQSDAANELLCEVFKSEPQNAEAIAVLGLNFYHQGNLEKSIEVFSNALEMNPKMMETKMMRDKAQRLMKILQTSKEMLTNYIRDYW